MERREYLWPLCKFIKHWNVLKRECKILSCRSNMQTDLGHGQWAYLSRGSLSKSSYWNSLAWSQKGNNGAIHLHASCLQSLTRRKEIVSCEKCFIRSYVCSNYIFRKKTKVGTKQRTTNRHLSFNTSLSWPSWETPWGIQNVLPLWRRLQSGNTMQFMSVNRWELQNLSKIQGWEIGNDNKMEQK